MTTNLRAAFVLDLLGNLPRQARSHAQAMQRFGRTTEYAMERSARRVQTFNRRLDMLTNRYSAFIGAAAAGAAVLQSARLDKTLIQIGQTAGASQSQIANLRKEIFRMSLETGQPVDSLLEGFNSLVQSGLSFDQALATIEAINPAMAVTGSQAQTLAAGLSVAAQAFDFDLSNPQKAVELLDKMTVAGRAGNAELEDLASVFGRIGGNARQSGLTFEATLALAEQLSLLERDPSRLATLTDSTLRLFTNERYRTAATKATGVQFYNGDGSGRDPLEVLDDLAKGLQQQGTKAATDKYLSDAFGTADLDTIRGLRELLSAGSLENLRGIARQITEGGGTIARDLPAALQNAVDQTARLKGTMREAGDALAQPVNAAITKILQVGIDDLGVDGKTILGAGAVGVVAAKAGGRAAELFFLGRIASKGTRANPMFVKGALGADIGGNKPRGNHRDPYGAGGDMLRKGAGAASLLATGLYGAAALGTLGFLGYVLHQGMTGPQLNGMGQDTIDRLGQQSASDGAIRELRGSEARLRRLEESIERVRANESPRTERMLEQLLQARAQLLVTVEDDRVRARVISTQGVDADVSTGRMDTQP